MHGECVPMTLYRVPAVQELPQPELQPLATEAKLATSLLKYLPLPAALLPQATSALAEGTRADLWPTRAAALVFAQVSTRAPCLPAVRKPAFRRLLLSGWRVQCAVACAHAEREAPLQRHAQRT